MYGYFCSCFPCLRQLGCRWGNVVEDDGFRLDDKLDQKVDWIFADFFASLSYRWKDLLGPSPFIGSIATG